MPTKSAFKFLKNSSRFRTLSDETLRKLVSHMAMKYYPGGTLILRQDDPSPEELHIIKQGSVMVYTDREGQREVLDYRGEGDHFGFTAAGGKSAQAASVEAVEDLVTYCIRLPEIPTLITEDPALAELLTDTPGGAYRFPTGGEIQRKSLLYGESEKLLFTAPVRELATRNVVLARKDMSIAEAARLMSSEQVGSLVVTGEDDLPEGLVTNRDLRDRVLATGRSAEAPVSEIMSTHLVTVEGGEFCFAALLKMINHDIHHLLVVESGKLTGVISTHDFMMLQGTSPLVLVEEIDTQENVEGLIPVSRKIMGLVSLLLREGARASAVTRIITEVNDRLERKVLTIARKALGPPPLPFCWIIYGSAGRKEQTFKTDQDNGLIYQDPRDEGQAQAAKDYFTRYAEFVADGLRRCGFADCPGNYMATNPEWCQPLSVWKRYFSRWIREPTTEAIVAAVILFDFRGLYGDHGLASELKAHLMDTLRGQALFLKYLADMATSVRPPLSSLRTFVLETDSAHRNKINLKNRCIAPLINIVRLFSLESGVPETSTLERIAALKSRHGAVKESGDALEQAFEFISLLRIHHQFEQISSNLEPDNFIDPAALGRHDQKTLKEACRVISRVLDGIQREYGN